MSLTSEIRAVLADIASEAMKLMTDLSDIQKELEEKGKTADKLTKRLKDVYIQTDNLLDKE